MNKIRILPEILANKIAAGEIVERPASVVKELLENALDAKCTSIHVSVVGGGKRSVLVRDDGEGMNQDDAILAFEHHATSKLQSAEDLGSITTLGFRGEALPSMASVSRLSLKTRTSEQEDATGTEIEIQGGVLRSVKPIPWDKGTEITVRDLFFNVPARKKFLRSNDTELGHITRLVTHYALAHPEIRFVLESEGRLLVDAFAVQDMRDRIFQIFGERFLANLIELSGQDGGLQVRGFASRPNEQKTNSYSQFFYVNGRMVRDKVIASAIRKAYGSSIPSSAYPIVILFLELPFDAVDVNVHPAKTEVRFRDQAAVHRLILGTIQHALMQNAVIPSFTHRASGEAVSEKLEVPSPSVWTTTPSSHPEREFRFVPAAASPDPLKRALNYPFGENPLVFETPKREDHQSLRLSPDMLFNSPAASGGEFQAQGVRILGQLRESYIIACDRKGLLIVDQHVAHERILYEKLAAAMQGNRVETQGLLVPISLEIPPHQQALLERVMPELNKNGFQVEHFGGAAVLIRSVPAVARESDCQKLLSEILEGLDGEDRTLDVERIKDRIAVGTACRAAIKINTPLTAEKMQWLLDQLALTRIPMNCPHGRPIVLRFTMAEIERNFGRI